MLTYFFSCFIFYFFFFLTLQIESFCQSAFVLTNNSLTVVDGEHRYWRASETVLGSQSWFRIQDSICEWKFPATACALRAEWAQQSEAPTNSSGTHLYGCALGLGKCPVWILWRHCSCFDWSLHFDCKLNSVPVPPTSMAGQQQLLATQISSQLSPPCPHLGLGFH